MDDWRALQSGDFARFSAAEQAALRYTEKITRTPTADAAREADALKPLFSDEQIVDIAATVALANLTNRLTDGLGIELEFEPQEI